MDVMPSPASSEVPCAYKIQSAEELTTCEPPERVVVPQLIHYHGIGDMKKA